jgi:hypothetical protein
MGFAALPIVLADRHSWLTVGCFSLAASHEVIGFAEGWRRLAS